MKIRYLRKFSFKFTPFFLSIKQPAMKRKADSKKAKIYFLYVNVHTSMNFKTPHGMRKCSAACISVGQVWQSCV